MLAPREEHGASARSERIHRLRSCLAPELASVRVRVGTTTTMEARMAFLLMNFELGE